MSNTGIVTRFDLGDGRIVEIETGRLARQADGAVVVKMGDCMLLATVVAKHEIKEGVDFLPLSVDYQEKFASVGRFPGGFFKREARLSDYEILISRIVDRALRPLFPEDYHAEKPATIGPKLVGFFENYGAFPRLLYESSKSLEGATRSPSAILKSFGREGRST